MEFIIWNLLDRIDSKKLIKQLKLIKQSSCDHRVESFPFLLIRQLVWNFVVHLHQISNAVLLYNYSLWYVPLRTATLRRLLYSKLNWRRDHKLALQTLVGHILTWTFLLFTFLLWHSLSSNTFVLTQFCLNSVLLHISQSHTVLS